MKKIWIICLLIGFASSLHGKITLPEAVKKGLARSAAVQNQRLGVSASQSRRELARKQKLFSALFNGSYLYRSVTMELQLPDISAAPGVTIPGISREVGALHNFDLKLGITQPLYSGGILSSAVRKETVQAAAAESLLRLKQIEASGSIKTSYFSHLLLLQKKHSLHKLLKNLELHLKKIRDYYREELVRKSDLLETQQNIEEIRMQLADLERSIQEERIHFFRLCGLWPEEVEETYREKEQDLETALAYFKQHHPQLEALNQRLKLTEIQDKMVGGKYLPQVNGFAEVHYGRPGIDFFKNEWSLYFQGGLSFNLPIFNWNRKKQERAVVKIYAQQIENEKQDFILETGQRLEQLFAARNSLHQKQSYLEKIIGYAREDAQLKEQLYRENQIANIDYLTAVTTAEGYRSQKQEMRFQLELLKVSIHTVIGYLTEDVSHQEKEK